MRAWPYVEGWLFKSFWGVRETASCVSCVMERAQGTGTLAVCGLVSQ